MRRFYLLTALLLLVALSALVFASKSSAQQADEIQKYIGQWEIEKLPEIEQGQAQYFATNGYYWQGLATHSEAAKPVYDLADQVRPIEKDAKLFAPDCLDCKPTDQLAAPSWSELFPGVIDKLPADLSIDIYDGPSGMGYTINLSYCVDAVCYRKSVSIGAEAWRSVDWYEIKPLDESVIK